MQMINFIGTYTLFLKETKRFTKVYNQTLIAPAVTALLFLAVFNLAMSNHVEKIGNIPFNQFMASGLIMMSILQNAFANTSSSLVMGKVLGNIIDYLIPPITAGEMVFAMVMAGVVRGVCVGLIVAASIYLFVDITIYSLTITILFVLLSSILLSLLGLLAGIIADTFDQIAAITSYVVTPLAFLSGTFYSVQNLPKSIYNISHLNPFFYMIDGFRYGMTGYSDSNVTIGMVVTLSTSIALWITVQILITRGYKIKN